MSQPPQTKRHTRKQLGDRRATRDPSSSRDASEEDNDNIDNSFSDAGSVNSAREVESNASTVDSHNMPPPASLPPYASASTATNSPRRALHQKRVEELGADSQSEGLDSPTYDGDVESSSTIGGTPAATHQPLRRSSSPIAPLAAAPSSGLRQPTPKASQTNLASSDTPSNPKSLDDEPYYQPRDVPVAPSKYLDEAAKNPPRDLLDSNSAGGPPKMYTRPAERTEADIKAFVERAIHGRGAEDGVERWWRTNPPPEGKVVRVYADGVYDLFHFGHNLQLRQAKLSFPKVHLLVGVCSDKLCADHKSAPAMTHAERCEAVRNCRWADEVIPDAPWVIDQEFLNKYNIDYIAHDEVVYPSKDHEDVYAFAKTEGRFVPTRRTPAISTSDLLERIVRGYRDGFFDSKLEKNGHPELAAADVDWDSSASVEKRERRKAALKAKK
ncbi:hypothetical protein IAR50_001902 [Cryptococcus sp. DSM 104548]